MAELRPSPLGELEACYAGIVALEHTLESEEDLRAAALLRARFVQQSLDRLERHALKHGMSARDVKDARRKLLAGRPS